MSSDPISSPHAGSSAGSSAGSVAVIGGGIVGLVMARRARALGYDVELFEASPELGGLTASWTLGPITWDRFYHVILGSDSAWREVLRDLGLDSEIRWRSTRTGCLAQGRMHSVSSPRELLSFRPLGMLSRLRLGATLAWATQVRNGRALERVLVADWLVKLSGRAAFERFWRPLLVAKLGTSWPQTSAAFIWATAQRLGRARGTAAPGAAAAPSAARAASEERFGFVPGSYARIVAVFADRLRADGVTMTTGASISRVEPSDTGPRVVMGNGEVRSFDKIICTVPAPAVRSLVPSLNATEHAMLASVMYQGVVCVSLVLDAPLHPYYLTYLLDDSALTAIVDMSALVDADQFAGAGLVYLPRYCAPDDPLMTTSDAEVTETFVAELARLVPEFRRERIVASGVARAKHVFAVPTLGYSDRVLPFATSVPGVAIVHGAQIVNATLNVDESVQLANRAADELFSDAVSREVSR